MLTNSTKKKIDTARDILVGKIPMPTSQVEQITLALTYKFMSDMDKAARELGDTSGFFANGYERYAWDKLMDKSLPARDRVKLYGEGLEKMALNPHIPQLFRDIFRNAFLPFNDPETLKLFLDTIDQFEYEHSEELGNAFEYLLQVMGSQGDAGQFRTPRHIIDFIVEVVDPKKTDKILDPACGTAGFLISAYKHLKTKGLKNDEMETVSDNFVGYDISQDMQRLSLVNMYLHQFPDPHIYEYDTLTSEERWEEDFDVILANPPFMTPKGGIKPHNRFSVPSKRAEVLFVDYIMEHLTVNGKAGVIVPEGIIFQSQNAYKKLRKMMVDDDYLWAVVSLPSGVFQPYSGVKTSILLFDRQLAKKTNKILFIRVNNDGYDLGAQRRAIKKNNLPEATKILKDYKQSLIDGKEMDLEGAELAHVVDKKEIRDGGYILTSERYKAITKVSSDFEVVNLSEVCEINPESSNPEDFNTEYFTYIDVSSVENGTGTIDFTNKIKVSDAPSRARRVVKATDVLLSTVRPNLKAFAYLSKLPSNSLASTGFAVLRAKEKLEPRYLWHILMSQNAVDQMIGMMGKGAYPSINQKDVSSIKIPLPPLSVQQEIVEELDGYQKIIDLASEMTQVKGINITIDPSWETKQLDDLCDIEYGLTASAKDTGDARFIRITDINEYGHLDPNDPKFVDLDDESKKYLLSKGDVVVARTGATFGKSLIYSSDEPAIFASYLIRLNFDEKQILPEYYWCFAQTQNYWKQAESLVTGGGQPQFNANVQKKIQVPLPSLEKQKEVADEFIRIRRMLIHQNEELVNIFSQKIAERIDLIWGTDK